MKSATSPFWVKTQKKPPFEFVLDALETLHPQTRPMFGCLAVYVGEKLVLILRDRGNPQDREDDGIWVVMPNAAQAHELRRDLPSLRPIRLFEGGGPTVWQVIPVESDNFEEEALRACELIQAGDPRIGKVPAKKPKKRPARR